MPVLLFILCIVIFFLLKIVLSQQNSFGNLIVSFVLRHIFITKYYTTINYRHIWRCKQFETAYVILKGQMHIYNDTNTTISIFLYLNGLSFISTRNFNKEKINIFKSNSSIDKIKKFEVSLYKWFACYLIHEEIYV